MNKYNDYTNAFKIYKKKTLLNLFPLISENFNIFLELPLKIISRKYTYKIIPISWKGRIGSGCHACEQNTFFHFVVKKNTLWYCKCSC